MGQGLFVVMLPFCRGILRPVPEPSLPRANLLDFVRTPPGPCELSQSRGESSLTSCEPSPLHPSQALLIPCEPPLIPGGPSPPWPSRVTFLSRRAHEGHGNVRMLEVLTFLSGHLPSGHTSAGTLREMTIFVTSGVDWAGGSPGGADMAGARVELAWPGPGGVGVVDTRRDSGQGSVARSR